ncbi:MAG: glycosyltransferase family 2 protein [archaeon]|nr:glycosyltransferase family 2 protein [archaeon]
MIPELSIIIPCYNEAENIPLILERFSKILDNTSKNSIELILVDNNSKDSTKEVLSKELSKKGYSFTRTISQPIPGYGAAIHKGLKFAKGEFLCWTHADLQTDPEDCLKALKFMKKLKSPGNVFIKGNRKGRPFLDKFFEAGMSLFETIILGKSMYDINAQPNLFHKSFLKFMKKPPQDFSFDLYAYYLAKKNKYNIKRFEVLFPKRIHGHSAWNFGFKSKIKFIKRTIDFTIKLKGKLKNENSYS